jgi:hypothetical protein
MSLIKSTLSAVAIALTTGAIGVGTAVANAEPTPPPPPLPAEAQGAPAPAAAPIELVGEPPAPNAPRKPTEVWDGKPVVWTSMWGGRWGVWINGAFMPLTSNVNTNGG